MRKFVLAAVAALSSPVSPPRSRANPPKLLVVISVDQFSANLFDEYRPQFTGGLARLASGTVFRNGYQSHAATETCPGHSTILTGDHPARTGIIANVWIDQVVARADKSVYCAEDETRAGHAASINYKVSPKHLRVPTLGELMKARWPGSRNVAVAGKDRAAVMMGGHDRRSALVLERQGLRHRPRRRAGAAGRAARSTPRSPQRSRSRGRRCSRRPSARRKAQPIPLEGGGKPVGAGRSRAPPATLDAFRASPEFDGDTLALAAGLVDEMQLGRGADPDLLAISLSATDYVGHTYGTEGEEMCLQLLELDRELGDFFALPRQPGIDYAVVLTADHGGNDIPERERLARRRRRGARRSGAEPERPWASALIGKLGLPGPGLLGDEHRRRHLCRPQPLAGATAARCSPPRVAAYRAHPQVEAVFTADELAATPVPTGPPDQLDV